MTPIRAFAFTLLHFLWQGAAVALALALALAALPGARASARARYAAACVALALLALAPAATLALFLARPAARALVRAAPDLLARAPAPGDRALALLVYAWLAGALLMTARLAGGLVQVRRIVRLHAAPLPDAWQRRLARLREGLGVRCSVYLLGSTQIDVPMIVGWLKPTILVPLAALSGLSTAQLEALLAHELAHIRRWDYLVNLLQTALEAALFYHPAVHWISGRVRLERELCCDDAVVELLHDPVGYARALAELETLRSTTPSLALASTGGPLLMRIQRILSQGIAPPSRPRAWLAPALLLASALGLTAAGLSACRAEADEPRPATAAAPARATAVDIPWLPPVLDRYKPVIVAAAARYGVDPDALAIVTLVESRGDPKARSSWGAVGLMQLMPATAARIAVERGLEGPTDARLLDPAYNLDLGGYYFAQQLAAFGGDGDPSRGIELAAAAYNGGSKSVRAYLDGTGALSEETERYKALVVGMWNERGEARSATYEAWRERVRGPAAAKTESPLPGGRVTLPFGKNPDPWSGQEYFHEGVDLAGAASAKVRAPLDGVVEEAAEDGDRGNVVVIDHGRGLKTRFHHLGELDVKLGQSIGRGEIVGTVGATGKVTGPHVHFEVRDNDEPLDPARYLGREAP